MAIPFIKAFDPEYGEAVPLSPLVTRVVAKNPGPFTFTGSGTYLVGDREGVAVIDPGPQNDAHRAALLAAAPGPITVILVTHTHLDHSGGAAALAAETGAPVIGFAPHAVSPDKAPPALDEGADWSLPFDSFLADGDDIALPACRLTAIHTPGHCANHLCFSLEAEGALFTGDHIMGWATTVIAPPDGDMEAYLDSLDRLLAREDRVYYPTHGAPIADNPKGFVEAIKAHRLARDAAILAAVPLQGDPPVRARDIAAAVYTDIPQGLLMAATLNVTAHLARQEKAGLVLATDGGYCRL
ncbi:metallo-beta-lactamase family protein [Parvularcula bermudensis HTCC2503]|uniref:Metallo-beta-lactamase family protein n=1 Tax=Parvularcula bermudensis (strain ATCC BAA-594 / HTCC2503 / KCTC 12087) TaxID=314260 RepID=E0THQ8_PARBH|nr:MBL fold metallo-hydrolase [Parvularcula bermudensis]ADM09354.1 metallo-beta-lactamase family protein [Parvularcula bermudensis HTCC2503]